MNRFVRRSRISASSVVTLSWRERLAGYVEVSATVLSDRDPGDVVLLVTVGERSFGNEVNPMLDYGHQSEECNVDDRA